MKWGKRMYRMFVAASTAHARWDYETSMSILQSKRKMCLLGLMLVPAVLVSVATIDSNSKPHGRDRLPRK